MCAKIYTLPALPYAYDALEPSISAQIMELYHKRAIKPMLTTRTRHSSRSPLPLLMTKLLLKVSLQGAIRFNGGGHINHSLFWRNLAPAGRQESDPTGTAVPELTKYITQTWGSLATQEDICHGALRHQRQWLRLTMSESATGLRIITTKDQDPPVNGEVPIIGVVMWEHAYYLQYLNDKVAYVDNIWKIINWKTTEEWYLRGPADAAKMIDEAV